MTMPSPFEMGRMVGGNTSKAFSGYQEASTLDQILQNAAASQNPEDLQNVMGQIMQRVAPEKQQIAMQILQNKASMLAQGQQQQKQQQSNQSFSKLTGLDPEIIQGMTPREREIYLTKGTLSNQQKKGGDTALLQKAFTGIEDIVKSGYTGYSEKALSGKAREDRAKLNNLSEIFISHLIPLINPKGTMSKERFNYIKSLTPRGFDTDATIKGKLGALKTIFSMSPDQLGSFESMPDQDFKALFTQKNAANIAQQAQQNISDEQLDALLQKTGGDIDAAMQMLNGQ